MKYKRLLQQDEVYTNLKKKTRTLGKTFVDNRMAKAEYDDDNDGKRQTAR